MFFFPAAQKIVDLTADYPAPITITRARQKNMTLSIHPTTGTVRVRAPRWVGKGEIVKFLSEQRTWVSHQLAKLPPPLRLSDGATIPYMGGTREIKHAAYRARGIIDNGTQLLVGGDATTLGARLKKWLALRTRHEVREQALRLAAITGQPVGTLAVRDMHACWGVCSGRKTRHRLCFNWRLILCPPDVLNYVVAHEVAHMTHMNHSRDFWALVATLHSNVKASEDYLNGEAATLLRIDA
jgi:predicted metal-dependent hydrolase